MASTKLKLTHRYLTVVEAVRQLLLEAAKKLRLAGVVDDWNDTRWGTPPWQMGGACGCLNLTFETPELAQVSGTLGFPDARFVMQISLGKSETPDQPRWYPETAIWKVWDDRLNGIDLRASSRFYVQPWGFYVIETICTPPS